MDTGITDVGEFVPRLLLLTPIVFIGNLVGISLRFPELGSAVLFPPYAMLTAALVVSPRRQWIWFILVSAIAHAAASLPHWSLAWVLAADVANIARAVAAAALLRWSFGGYPRLSGLSALLSFVASAVVVAPAVGATIGAANVVLQAPATPYWRPWTAWFMASALTGLTMLPVCLAAMKSVNAWRAWRLSGWRALELASLTGLLGLACVTVFLLGLNNRGELALFLYGPLPLLIWAAARFGIAGASLALTAVAAAAIWGADRGTGPFPELTPDARVLTLQLYVLLTAVPVLCIAAVGDGRYRAVQLYRALLASLQDHVAVLDARGVVLEVNDSWLRFADAGHECPFERLRAGDDYVATCRVAIARRTRGSANGDSVAERALAGVASVLSGDRGCFEMEYEQDANGTPEWYAMRVEVLQRAEGGAVVTRANVSARHRAQLLIDEQRRELGHLARVGVLGQLSGALAHELKQPLTAILSNAQAAQLLLRRPQRDVDEMSAILDDIVTNDRRATQVIDGLRAMLQRGEVDVQSVDTGELLREVLELAHAELITRRITATVVVEPDLPPVLAQRVQIKQVLLNLVLNACEAMDAVTGSDRQLVLTSAGAGPGEVRLSVTDRGSGIPAAAIDRVFEPFMTTKPNGLGLGLSIVRTILTAHGGRIWAENNPAGGATFHCILASAAANEPRGVSWPRNGAPRVARDVIPASATRQHANG